MPLILPPFAQYQSPIVPLRGLWNATPPEGDKFISCEIDWLTTTGGLTCQQFAFSGNSPVAISQIVALSVDNSRSGADVEFVFADSGTLLAVPAHVQLVSPVFTNGLMLYANAPGAIQGDITCFTVHNSMPPPIPIAPTAAQNHSSLNEASLANGTTPLILPPTSGTLNTLSITVYVNTTTTGDLAQLSLIDGTGKNLWTQVVVASGSPENLIFNLSGLSLRFQNGVSLVIAESTLSGGVTVNAYYSTP